MTDRDAANPTLRVTLKELRETLEEGQEDIAVFEQRATYHARRLRGYVEGGVWPQETMDAVEVTIELLNRSAALEGRINQLERALVIILQSLEER